MAANRIRPIAIAVVRHGDRMLVEHGFDSVKQEHFWRPPGGGIEFGEKSVDALRREFQEELAADLHDPALIGILENLFEYEGAAHHEIVFVFESRFTNPALYDQQEFLIEEPGLQDRATWVSLDELIAGENRLKPSGLLELLRERRAPRFASGETNLKSP